MTIVSTKEAVTPLDLGEGSNDLFPETSTPSFPPVDDAITFLENVNWANVGARTRKGIGDLILFAAKFSEKSFDFHIWLAKKLG